MEETITIDKTHYEYLLDREMYLEALEEAGVDNWIGYGEAMDTYRKWKEELNK